jgi:hypothetical protein
MPETNNNITRDGTTAQLPFCTICNRQMARSGRALRELRANPSVYAGWTHRQCRSGTITTARPASVRAEARPPQPTIAPDFRKVNITLDKTKSINIDIKKYDNFFIGLELESNLTIEQAKQILGFAYEVGKTNGITKKKIRKSVGDVAVEFNQEIDLYKQSELISQIYYDGSIGAEVVTRPLQLSQWDKLKDVHKKLKAARADFYANGRGGTHMTFLNDSHKELSRFDKVAVQNLVQFSRMFFWDLIAAFGYGGKTRKIQYRRMASLSDAQTLRIPHGIAITPKWEDGYIWGIEIRFPDGCGDFDFLVKQAKFWSAMIRQSAIIAQAGYMNFPQSTWDEITLFQPVYREGSTTAHNILNPQIEKICKESLQHFGYYEQPLTPEQRAAKLTEIENLVVV